MIRHRLPASAIEFFEPGAAGAPVVLDARSPRRALSRQPQATRHRSGLARAALLAVLLGAVIYAGLTAWAGWREVAECLTAFAWWTAAAAAALAAANYLVRFVRWELYLRRLHIVVPRPRSFGIFLAGFALTATPGKMGEVLKSYLLREAYAVPIATSAPILIAERVSDLLALLILSVIGFGEIRSSRPALWAGAAFIALVMVAVSSETLCGMAAGMGARFPGVRRIVPKVHEFHRASRALHRPEVLFATTVLSVVAWGCECLAFWLVLRGFGATPSLKLSAVIYATATIAGALSFLPGGLGVQEGGMVALLVASGRVIGRPAALAATFVTRLTTLWFAVALGVGALLWIRQRIGSIVLDDMATHVGNRP